MATDLTLEAAAGWNWQHQNIEGVTADEADDACPYMHSSPAAMAWHLGRHLAKRGYVKPDHARGTAKVFMSRGYSLRLDVKKKPSPHKTFFQWFDDNSFNELA